MNAIAANTLLKMLEEPPPATFFVLVSDSLDDVLPTIRSRCVLVQVPAPPAAACLPWLAEQGIADPVGALALASGGPLAALPAAAEEAIAAEASAALYRLLERGPALTPAQVATGLGRDPPVAACVRLMQCWGFDILQYRERGSVRYHPRREASISTLAASARPDGLWRWLDALRGASAAREHPLNARLLIESLLTRYIDVF
jgi:DNA polymerase-3 subunit delta'